MQFARKDSNARASADEGKIRSKESRGKKLSPPITRWRIGEHQKRFNNHLNKLMRKKSADVDSSRGFKRKKTSRRQGTYP
jgi:hypothetical protein